MRIDQEPRPFTPDGRPPQDIDELVFLWEIKTLTPSDR